MEELTKAQQFLEIAKWVKSQNPEFMKNFKSMASIIEVYKRLPALYKKGNSLPAYLKKEKTFEANRLKLILNSLFEFRYFNDAPPRYTFKFGLGKYGRPGKEITEVRCTPIDNCSLFRANLFKRQEYGTAIITIKELRDAKRAADRLLESVIKSYGDDYETIYGEKLLEAMKEDSPTGEELNVGIEVVI